MITGLYERLLALGNLALFNDELDAGTLPEPRCSRCGNGVPVCVEVGLPCSIACRGFRTDMPICWGCEKDLYENKCLHGYGIKQGPCPICDAPKREDHARAILY